jgi:hypothetical protein
MALSRSTDKAGVPTRSKGMFGYDSKADDRIMSASRVAVVSSSTAARLFPSPSNVIRGREVQTQAIASEASEFIAPQLNSKPMPSLEDYAKELDEFDDMSKKVDKMLADTVEKQVVEDEYRKVLRHETHRLTRIHEIWTDGVYNPIMNNVRAQIGEHQQVVDTRRPVSNVSTATSVAATRLFSMGTVDDLDEDMLRTFQGYSANAPRLRKTLDGSQWKAQSEFNYNELRTPIYKSSTASAVYFNDFATTSARVGRDAAIDADFPRGKRTDPSRSISAPIS